MISSSPLSASLLAQRLPFSGGRIFIVLCFISFVKCSAVPASFRHPSRSIPAPNPHPRGSGQRSWTAGLAKPDRRGKNAEADGGKLAFIRAVQVFPCRGACTQPTFLPSNSTQSAFMPQTGSLFLSLYAPRYCLTASAGFGRQFTKLRALSRLRRRYDARKKRSPRILHPSLLPHPKSNALLQGWRRALLYCFLFMHIRKARAAVYDVCRPMCTARYSIRAHRSIGPRPSRTTPQRCASTQISRSITALARPITGRG